MTESMPGEGAGGYRAVPAPPPATRTPEGVTEAAEARVAAALADIDAVADRPPADQVPAFATAQQTLQATLAGIDEN